MTKSRSSRLAAVAVLYLVYKFMMMIQRGEVTFNFEIITKI